MSLTEPVAPVVGALDTVLARLNRAWVMSHLAFWGGYLVFRAAAAMSAPPMWDDRDLTAPLMANRATVVAALCLLSGLALWAIAATRRPQPSPLVVALLVAASGLALLPLAQQIEMISGQFYMDGVLSWRSISDDGPTPFLGYVFGYGWVLVLWAATQAIVAYHVIVTDQRRRLADSQALFQKAQLEMLRYQINPHFLFNTLNAISALVLERRNADAERMLLRLCDFLRYSLEGDQRAMEPMAREIEAQRAYLEIEKARFGDRLRVTFNVERGAEDALAPAMILQPLLENAIRHAVAPSPDGAKIDVSVRRDGNDLVLTIEDDGPDSPTVAADPRPGIGLRNAQRRVELQWGARARLTAGPIAPHGFRAQIVMPFALAQGAGQ